MLKLVINGIHNALFSETSTTNSFSSYKDATKRLASISPYLVLSDDSELKSTMSIRDLALIFQFSYGIQLDFARMIRILVYKEWMCFNKSIESCLIPTPKTLQYFKIFLERNDGKLSLTVRFSIKGYNTIKQVIVSWHNEYANAIRLENKLPLFPLDHQDSVKFDVVQGMINTLQMSKVLYLDHDVVLESARSYLRKQGYVNVRAGFTRVVEDDKLGSVTTLEFNKFGATRFAKDSYPMLIPCIDLSFVNDLKAYDVLKGRLDIITKKEIE